MKIHLTALVAGLAASVVLSPAQDTTPPADAPPVVHPADATPVANPTDSPADVPAPPHPEVAISQGGGADPGARAEEIVELIAIDDVPLTDAIRNLARQSGLNIQFDPRVTSGTNQYQSNVGIRFEKVTASDALLAVLDNHGLQLVADPKSRIARVTIKDPKAEDPLVARLYQLKYSDPTNLTMILKTTLSSRSSVVADVRTSQLIINTTEKEMEAAFVTLNKLDTATRQVLIEARLLETAHNPSSVKGIDWSGTLEGQRFTVGNNLGKPDGGPNANNLLYGTGNNPTKLLLDSSKGFNPMTAFLDADGVSAVLSFLNKDSDTEVVATPRAVTLDNMSAQLSVTRAFPIFQITPGSANSPAGAAITYTNLGTILIVTPRISADNMIQLRVVPEVSNIDSVDKQVLNGTENTANIYAIRRIETHVMIPSGNTLVMGGLINDTRTKSHVKVPLLGDLPFVGRHLFSKETKVRNKSNLIIFITPTIVEDADYHQTSSGREFMQTRVIEKPEPKVSAWDSAKPHDWTAPWR